MAVAALAGRWHRSDALPGFRLALGGALLWLTVIVFVPLAALALRPWSLGFDGVIAAISAPRVRAALLLSFGSAGIAALVDAVLGFVVAWTLVRHNFPLKRLVDALIDLPFALPTAVAGIALSTLYGPAGLLGAPLGALGIKAAYSPLGIVIALVFVGLPFVVRTLQPIMVELAAEPEEAAATLGASHAQTFWRVILPALLPALLSGATLAFARAVGEYGSVIFIAGNLPMVSEIAPLLIIIKLQQYDYAGASAIGLAMLTISFAILVVLNALQAMLAARR